MSGSVTAAAEAPGAIKQALNQTGWLDAEVVAAGHLRQGKAPTLAGMITGTALIELARPRRSKSLPRHFVLAATADRVVAFKASGYVLGEGSGPYMLKIKPGECGSWPRGSIRMVDLPEGPHSDGGTLELAGSERLPVSRPNLDGDPNTDELLELLGGGATGSSAKSPRQLRYQENQLDIRRASDVRPADYRSLAADAARGRPEFDLEGWASRRGLNYRGCAPQGGHLSVTCPWSEDVLFNVVRGHWPGGTDGVLCHEARVYDVDAPGFFHGGEVSGSEGESWAGFLAEAIIPLPLGGEQGHFFKVPYTSAGARVPHLATLTGLHVARRGERHTTRDTLFDTWQERGLDHLGLHGHWVAGIRKNSDECTVDRLLAGPIRQLLSVQQGLGFEIRIEYGQVIVSRQDFLRRDEDLDALVAMAEALAGAVRDICVPQAGSLALDTQLQPPEWLASVRRHRREKHTYWPLGARLEKVVQIADERGMAVEDPRAFHAAFPGLNFPGEAFGVLHGRLPGTTLTGRLLCCAERPMVLPDEIRKLLKDPGGQAGCDVAVVAVDADAPATAPEGEIDDGLRVAVADGVLTAWRGRRSWQADGEALDRLATDVAAIAEPPRPRGLTARNGRLGPRGSISRDVGRGHRLARARGCAAPDQSGAARPWLVRARPHGVRRRPGPAPA